MPSFCHESARVSPLADIEESVRGTRIVVGPHAVVDSFVKIKPAGGSGDVLFGSHTVLNSGCVLYNVAMAANCVFAPVNHGYRSKDKLIREQGFQPSKGGIVIENDVWIGAGCVLLDGAVLRRGYVIGGMSFVRGAIPAYSIQGGNPLRLLGWRG